MTHTSNPVSKELALSINPISEPDQPTLPENTTTAPAQIKYEISDEVLARQIFDKISAEAKARRRVEEFIRHRYRLAMECGLPDKAMTSEELDYIAPYVNVVNLDAAEDAFVKTAQRMHQGRKRRKSIIRWTGLGVLTILAIGVGIALWYPQDRDEQLDKMPTAIAPPAPQPAHQAATAMSCPDKTGESCTSGGSGGTQQTPETQVAAAKNALAGAEQSARSDATDSAVLARFREVLDEHRSALGSIGEIPSLEARIRALESLLEFAKTADALAGSASASLVEKRQADLAYISKARELRGAGTDLARISRRIEEWDDLLARHGTVLKIVMCVQREGLFCETSTQHLPFRTGSIVFATVSIAARTSQQPVTFKWLRDGNLERQERHTVEQSDTRGFRVNGEVRPRRPGNWEFCVYNDAGQLIVKVPFTVR